MAKARAEDIVNIAALIQIGRIAAVGIFVGRVTINERMRGNG